MPVNTTADVTAYASGRIGLNARIVGDLVALSSPDNAATVDAGRIFPEYLGSVDRVAEFVDSWRAK
jgi:hypothetical protein